MRHTLWQSFQFAGKGLQAAFWSQRTMRVHMGVATAVSVATVWLDLPVFSAGLLVLAMAVVLAAELMNTAVETLVDLEVGRAHHELAGRAKDLAAAGVVVTAAGAALVGVMVLGPPAAAAIGAGRLDALAVGRAATLLAVIGLVAVVLRRTGQRAAGERLP